MLILALVLAVAALIVLVVAVLTGISNLLWLLLALAVIAAVLLVVDIVRGRQATNTNNTEIPGNYPATPASAPAAQSYGAENYPTATYPVTATDREATAEHSFGIADPGPHTATFPTIEEPAREESAGRHRQGTTESTGSHRWTP